MNTDEWLPRALDRYELSRQGLRGGLHTNHLSSVEWVPHLIVHDDLLGPYLCIDSFAFPISLHPKEAARPLGRVEAVIGLVSRALPDFDTPYVVQEVAAGAFWGNYQRVLKEVNGRWGNPGHVVNTVTTPVSGVGPTNAVFSATVDHDSPDWSHGSHGAHSAHSDTDNRPRYYVLAFMQRVE